MTAEVPDGRSRYRGYRHVRKPIVDDETPWEEDDVCWYFVVNHPDGLTLEQIGELQDTTRERVRQIEQVAIRKVRNFARNHGIDLTYLAKAWGVDLHDIDW